MSMRGLTRKQALQRVLGILSLKPRKPRMKNKRSWRPKQSWYSDVQKLKGMGPFQSTNFMRLYLNAVHAPACHAGTFTSTGPGTRAGVN